MGSIMDFFDESVRRRRQHKHCNDNDDYGGEKGALTGNAASLFLEFAKTKQSKLDADEEKKLKAFFEVYMDKALHHPSTSSYHYY